MSTPTDRVIRAVTQDGSFRVIAVRTTETAREGIRVHGLGGDEARAFGELLTGAVLIRETMAPGYRVQVVMSGEQGGSIVTDSYPDDGLTRGLVSRPCGVERVVQGESSLLKVIRTLPQGRVHQSVVEAGAEGISEALMGYMQTSEQVTATLGVATVMDGDRVVASGGFVVQLLPECMQGPLMVMTERLNDFAQLGDFLVRHEASAETLLYELLYGFAHERLSDEAVVYGCPCSEERALGAVATLGADEIATAVSTGEVIDLTCEYCLRVWKFGPERLATLLAPN